MKLFLKFIFSFFLISLFFTPQKLYAQDFTYQKAYEDYVFTYDVYKKAHADYLLARSQYINAKTLASQTKAQEAGSAMLIDRDNVVITYLTALRLRLSETNGVSNTDKEGLYQRLDSEVLWYQTHRDTISSAASLDDLVADSDAASEHYTTIQGLIYEVLGTIPVGRVETVRTSATSLLGSIKTKTQEIQLNGDHDVSGAEHWITETENKLTRSLDKQIEAQKIIFSFQSIPEQELDRKNFSKDYSEITSNLQDSVQLINESASYMKEILTEIKTKS